MIDKAKTFIKKNKYLLLTFLLSSVVISIIYTLKEIAPFGNNSMLDVDFYHQYGPLLNELYDRIKSGETFLFSFNTGGGIPFFRNFLNYLSSPFNILLLLFKKENVVMAFSIIIAIKAVTSSVTMAFYLKKVMKKDGIYLCMFGLLYAFSGYFCAYYWNIMWLDGMVFLPIIMYGIHKLIKEEKPLIYILSLALMLLANYFIGYMICAFSVIYFLAYFLYTSNFKIKNVIKKFAIFFFSSLLAGALVAVFLIPLFYSLQSISATTDAFPSIMSNFNLIDYVFNHFSGVSRTVFASDVLPLPNVYCGLLTLVLIISLFFNRKVNTKFKLMAILAIILFLASFSINQIDFMWHAFHVPNDLPYRYSFLYVFTLITIASYSYVNLKKANRFGVYTSFIIVTLFIFLAYKFKFANLDSLECLTCLIFVIFYFITYLFSNFKFIPRRVIECFLIIFIMSEVTWGIKNNWSINHDIKNFMSTKDPFNKLICTVKEKDNSFYRIENTNYLTLNDGAWYDYPGISAFSSMAYESMAKTQRMLGLSGNNINSYYYKYYQTPVYNTMFSVKYLLGSYLVNPYYAFVDKEKSTNLVNYKYSLSPIYMVNSNLKAWSLSSYMPFYNQSNFVLLSTGVNNIYKDVSVIETKNASFTSKEYFSKTNGEYEYRFDENNNGNYIDLTLYNEKRGNVYLYVGGSEVKSFEVNGVRYDITSDEYFTLDTGLLEEGSFLVRINTGSNSNAKLKFYAYSIDDLAFNRFYDYLSKGQMNIKKYRDNMFEGSITANKNQLAFTSITYDDGWKVFIDKRLVNTYKIADSFLAFDVPPGHHEVKIIYYPKGMKTGLIISLFSMLLIIIIWSKKLVKQRNKQICKKKDEFNV